MRRTLFPLLLSLLLTTHACRPTPRSSRTYDEIRQLVAGRSADEVQRLLGPPDLRQAVLDDQRWIWWGYTVLDGPQYAPEVRGQIVHLEITFQKRPPAGWQVAGPLAVSYTVPAPRNGS